MQEIKFSQKVWQDPIYFIAFGFGFGLMPFMPGTWGTLAAIPIYFLIMNLPAYLYLLIVILAFIIGVNFCDKVSHDLGIHDYKGIVWDEVVGYLLTMFLAPPGLLWMLLGFVLFRFFDIWKPQPIRFVDQKIKGGMGIMLDDILAAIPAWLIIQMLWILFK